MKALNNLSLISIPINESLTQYAGKVYLCGGAVRDYIMDPNIIPKDYDLVVDMEDGGIKFAEDICKFYGVYKENSNPVTYNKFKTAKFVIHGIEFESVCPRKESYDSNNRKPSVEKSTLYEDAIRRDLTINALYYNLTTNEIIDFVGGVNDIKNKILKTPLDPFTTFTDDPLRMLRAFRFNARFNDYVLDDNILDAVRSCEPRISIVSKERVQDELIKILSVTDSVHLAKILSIMMECGLFNNIIPELVSLKNMPQGIVHTHRNVWEHTLNAIKNTKKDPILRLAVLLHDVGKISTMKYIDKDNIKYPNHHIEGESIVKERLKDLKFTNKQIKLIANAVKMHMSFNTIYFK
ncbi:MAG: CCA tRNA nucleotidyltransferase, partial [Bacilli bacterium]